MREWKYKGIPIAYETGNWDGKRSGEVIAEDDIGRKFVARVYYGFMDGSEFVTWVDNDDCIINREIVRWIEIPE